MKREFWAIGNTFGYAIKVLNSIFCSDGKTKDGKYNEEEGEYSEEEMWLVAEQVNSMCSKTMLEDALIIISMADSLPENRLCEQINCISHHSKDYQKHDFRHTYNNCKICIHNNFIKEMNLQDKFQLKK